MHLSTDTDIQNMNGQQISNFYARIHQNVCNDASFEQLQSDVTTLQDNRTLVGSLAWPLNNPANGLHSFCYLGYLRPSRISYWEWIQSQNRKEHHQPPRHYRRASNLHDGSQWHFPHRPTGVSWWSTWMSSRAFQTNCSQQWSWNPWSASLFLWRQTSTTVWERHMKSKILALQDNSYGMSLIFNHKASMIR